MGILAEHFAVAVAADLEKSKGRGSNPRWPRSVKKSVEPSFISIRKAVYEECPECDGEGCEHCKKKDGPDGYVPHEHKGGEEVKKAETFSKPGTADVTPSDRKKIAPLARHYLAKPHPFTTCVRDQKKHGLTDDHAKRRCAVLLDAFDPDRKRHSVQKASDADVWDRLSEEERAAELRAVADTLPPPASGFDLTGG